MYMWFKEHEKLNYFRCKSILSKITDLCWLNTTQANHLLKFTGPWMHIHKSGSFSRRSIEVKHYHSFEVLRVILS